MYLPPILKSCLAYTNKYIDFSGVFGDDGSNSSQVHSTIFLASGDFFSRAQNSDHVTHFHLSVVTNVKGHQERT